MKQCWISFSEADLTAMAPDSELRRRAQEILDEQHTGDWDAYVRAAHDMYHNDGEIEIDDEVLVSFSDGICGRPGGAYVLAWVYVSAEDAGIEPEDDEEEDDDD